MFLPQTKRTTSPSKTTTSHKAAPRKTPVQSVPSTTGAARPRPVQARQQVKTVTVQTTTPPAVTVRPAPLQPSTTPRKTMTRPAPHTPDAAHPTTSARRREQKHTTPDDLLTDLGTLSTPDHLAPERVEQSLQTSTATLQFSKISGRLYVKKPGESSGITPGDIMQGLMGDCYLLAGMAAVAKTNPEMIKQMITQNKDGSITVRFSSRSPSWARSTPA